MPAPSVLVVWDYDTAIGQINATYPYNFREEVLLQEIENVETILDAARRYEIAMTFACVGFAAEPGAAPYHVPDQLKRIRADGHEIASHSWKHEWFPFLESEQVIRSLARSKKALEDCLGESGTVKGFVPPFSRPMTWYARGAVSFGDRSLSPWRTGGNIGSLCGALAGAGYAWCRVSYRSLGQRLRGVHRPELIQGAAQRSSGVACLPHHYTGFDRSAVDLVESAARAHRSVVIVGHPSGLTRGGGENLMHLEVFLQRLAELQQGGAIRARRVSDHLALEQVDR